MQYPFNLHSLTVCLTINFFFRVKPVREGERRSQFITMEKFFLEMNQSETKIACGGHVS